MSLDAQLNAIYSQNRHEAAIGTHTSVSIAMKRYRRLDRTLNHALKSFRTWIQESTWVGKERDCINLFVMQFLLPMTGEETAIEHAAQIRIEGAVPQPRAYARASATKDLVIWAKPSDVTWDAGWSAARSPRAVIEWKAVRRGKSGIHFDLHDQEWLNHFTREFPLAMGYCVSVDMRPNSRDVHWIRIRRGEIVGQK